MPDYYLCNSSTKKAIAGPFPTPFMVAALVDVQDNPIDYGTISRYELAKSGRYPRNKAGDAKLAFSVAESGKYKDGKVKCVNCGNLLKHSMFRGWFHEGYDEHGALEPAMTPSMEICGKPEPRKD